MERSLEERLVQASLTLAEIESETSERQVQATVHTTLQQVFGREVTYISAAESRGLFGSDQSLYEAMRDKPFLIYGDDQLYLLMYHGQSHNLGVFNVRVNGDGEKIQQPGLAQLAFRAFSRHCGQVMATAHTTEKLQRAAHYDGKTGLLQLEYFKQAIFPGLVEEAKPLVAIFYDLDDFKKYNSTFGHLQGDLALKTAASTILSHLRRPRDLAIRYGGEEFLIILPETNLAGGRLVAEVVRESIEKAIVPVETNENGISTPDAGQKYEKPVHNITCTGGLAAFPDHTSHPRETIAIANAVLLLGKKRHKNKVYEHPVDVVY